MPETIIGNMEQKRASFAYKCAKMATQENIMPKYSAYVKKLPMMIKTNGLGAALTFVFAKKNNKNKIDSPEKQAYRKLYEDIQKWLTEESPLIKIKLKKEEELIDSIVKQESQKYRMLTIETLAFLNWLKRFSEGMVKEEGE
ncbi:type III-B CRISPR module-associated protein Cmr5 [Candidatus Acidulodesulfobacterium sp. H_13]|uniref:type III-B CRISPR module-associated protein Cmr5 n=1 Tax=Candidatus Acidulodesulfobacterium sp. H_13 TaxID=3395470 RepID=UPI003AF4C108